MKSESVEPQGWKFGTIVGGYQLICKLIRKLCIKKQMNTNDASSIFMMFHHVPHPNSTESIESQGFLGRSHSIYSRFTICFFGHSLSACLLDDETFQTQG